MVYLPQDNKIGFDYSPIGSCRKVRDTRDFLEDPSLVLYLPLWYPELKGSPFLSKGLYLHSCTVTGALWRPDGRYFDGVDDKITVPDHAAFNTMLESFSVGIWVRFAVLPATNITITLVDRWIPFLFTYDNVADAYSIRLIYRVAPTSVRKVATYTLMVGIFFHLFGVHNTSDNSDRIYVNGVEQSSSYAAGSFLTPMAASATDILIGASTGGQEFNGDFGKVEAYNQALTSDEIRHDYLATKWRYQ